MQLHCFPTTSAKRLFHSVKPNREQVKDRRVTACTDRRHTAHGACTQSAAAVKNHIMMSDEFESLHLTVRCHAL